MRGRILPISTAVAAATTMLATTVAVAPANAHPGPDGQRPLSQAFGDDKGFDHDPYDFDVARALILGVLKLKPTSPLNVLTKGTTPVTVFVPKDVAFQELGQELLGVWIEDEAKLGRVALALLNRSGAQGVDAVEQMLLYHVVPDKTLTKDALKRLAGSSLRTAAAGNRSIKVRRHHGDVRLQDANKELRDPTVRRQDINAGNRQIAHGIDRLLIPVDLP